MIELRNLTRSEIDEWRLQKVASEVLGKEKALQSGVSVAFVGPKHMQELNRKYRRMDKPANVLSFPGGEFGLGEVVICPSVVRKQAKAYGITYERAIAWMLIHGLLHLLGYTHSKAKDAKTMELKEQRYLKAL